MELSLAVTSGHVRSRWWMPGVLVAAGAFVVLTGLLDDLVRVVFWELLASAALLVWYGPARRFWAHNRKE